MPQYLKEYIISIFDCEPVPASNRNFLGLLLNNFLTRQPYNHINRPLPGYELENYLQIKVLQSFRDRHNQSYNYISLDNESKFVTLLRKQLHREFFIHVIRETSTDPNKQIKQAIYDFCEKHNMTDLDKAYETLVKHLNRSKISVRKVIRQPKINKNMLLINRAECPQE